MIRELISVCDNGTHTPALFGEFVAQINHINNKRAVAKALKVVCKVLNECQLRNATRNCTAMTWASTYSNYFSNCIGYNINVKRSVDFANKYKDIYSKGAYTLRTILDMLCEIINDPELMINSPYSLRIVESVLCNDVEPRNISEFRSKGPEWGQELAKIQF